MTSWIIRALFAPFVLAPAFAAERPIVVGAIVSQSGMIADRADGYRKGRLVWQDEVNAAGGVRGRNVELRLLDDGSEAARNSALYQQLIRDDKADALIGPYGTAATLMAAAEAEKARHVMVNGAGSSVAVHRRLPRYVFQSTVSYAACGGGSEVHRAGRPGRGIQPRRGRIPSAAEDEWKRQVREAVFAKMVEPAQCRCRARLCRGNGARRSAAPRGKRGPGEAARGARGARARHGARPLQGRPEDGGADRDQGRGRADRDGQAARGMAARAAGGEAGAALSAVARAAVAEIAGKGMTWR